MAPVAQFGAPSLDMAISIRVEVYDSREAASAKKGTPIAKFRMRTPASTTFAALGASVALRYMKESAGTIKTLPEIACVVDKEDCTFDLDDSVDQIVPNEAVRVILDRRPVQLASAAHDLNVTTATPAAAPQAQHAQPLTTPRVTTDRPAQSQLRLSSSSRKPFLLTQRQGMSSDATPRPRAPSAAGKRDPYDIDSDSDVNDPPSRQIASARSKQRQFTPATARGQGQSAERGSNVADNEKLSSSTSVRPAMATASVPNSTNGTTSVVSGSERAVEPVPQGQGAGRPYVSRAEDLAVDDSASEGGSTSGEEARLSAGPSLRSLGKRAHHTVNDHVEVVEGPLSTGDSAAPAPTPIMLKNSRGVVPIYRKGETPSLTSDGVTGAHLENGGATAMPQHVLPQSSPGVHAWSQVAGHDAITPVARGIVMKAPHTAPFIDVETEFAGFDFDDLSDFELRPTARPVLSQPSHRTRTPSRSSMKQPRTAAPTGELQSSNHLRSSPLENKQRRMSQPRRATRTRSPLRVVVQTSQRGTNNRASQERFAGTQKTPAKAIKSSVVSSQASKPADPPSSGGRGLSGDSIRRWLAARQKQAPKAPPPEPRLTARQRSASVQEVVQQVKAMTEVKVKPKAQPSSIPAAFFAKSDEDEESESGCSADAYLPRSSQNASAPREQPDCPPKSPFSRASSRRSSLSSHRSTTRRGPVPFSPFCPMDSITVAAQNTQEAVSTNRFGRAYSKRVRQTFSDASESSDGDAGRPSIDTKHFNGIVEHLAVNTERCAAPALVSYQPEKSVPGSLQDASVVAPDQTQPRRHPAWRQWWHPWGWINRYETTFLAGGIIGNGPFEGYALFGDTPGVYAEGCEAPSEELLAAEDLNCRKDEFRLACRRERRRERRLRGDFLAHEDDVYDSPAELAREFEDDRDLSADLGISMSLEIPNSAVTGPDLDSRDNNTSEGPGREAGEELSLPESSIHAMAMDQSEDDSSDQSELADLPRGVSPSFSDAAEGDQDRVAMASDDLGGQRPAVVAVSDDKMAEHIVRMERTRQYALTGGASSQSQSQESSASSMVDPIQLNSLTRASVATSANSTNTSVLIARQLTCISSPPSNQELALLMSSSPAKQARSSVLGRDHGEEPGSESESNSSESVETPTNPLSDQRGGSVEVPQTPLKHDSTDAPNEQRAVTNNMTSVIAPAGAKSQEKSHIEITDLASGVRITRSSTKQTHKNLTKSSPGQDPSDLVIEIPALSREQRSQYSDPEAETAEPEETHPEKVATPGQLRSFSEINGIEVDVSMRKRASTPIVIDDDDIGYVIRESPRWLNNGLQTNSPLFSIPHLTGEDEFEHEIRAVSPIVAARARRRVTFGETTDTQDVVYTAESHPVPESPSASRNTTRATMAKGALKRASPTEYQPARPKMIPVVAFALSDSGDEDSVVSLNCMPNIVESGTLLRGNQPANHIKPVQPKQADATAQAPPHWSSNDTNQWPETRPSASQPLPVAHTRPRIVTPIPPPLIPLSSSSSIYHSRPNIIEIKSSVSSDSNRESDVVMISAPRARTAARMVSPPRQIVMEPIVIESSPSPSPSLSPSPPPSRPVAEPPVETQEEHHPHEEPIMELLDSDHDSREQNGKPEGLDEQIADPEAQSEEGPMHNTDFQEPGDRHAASQYREVGFVDHKSSKQDGHAPLRIKPEACEPETHEPAVSTPADTSKWTSSSPRVTKDSRPRKKKYKPRRKSRHSDAAAVANTMVQHPFVGSVARFGGRRSSDNQALFKMVARGVRNVKQARKASLALASEVPSLSAPGTFSPGCGGKREYSKVSQGAPDQHDHRAKTATLANNVQMGTILADATAHLRRGSDSPDQRKKKRKLSHDEDDSDNIHKKHMVAHSQPSSSATNIPSSHLSLISPPTTSRPSSAGSRDV